MGALSSAVDERSRKFLQLCLQRISQVGQNTIGENIGISGPTVSRFVSEDLERACQVIAAAGLKVVPIEMKCYPKGQIDAILTLAKSHLSSVEDAEQLSFEEAHAVQYTAAVK